MILIGIDPGKDGAIAVCNFGTDNIRVIRPPLIKAKRGRPLYDVAAISAVLSRLVVDRVVKANAGSIYDILAVLEWVHGMNAASGGTIANFERGYGQGLYQGLLAAHGIPHQLVSPQKWQATMHSGTPGDDTKQKSIVAAKRLFPNVVLAPEGAKKPHDGFADALLLAAYGRRIVDPKGAELERLRKHACTCSLYGKEGCHVHGIKGE